MCLEIRKRFSMSESKRLNSSDTESDVLKDEKLGDTSSLLCKRALFESKTDQHLKPSLKKYKPECSVFCYFSL
jgi:hypothetical protein